MFKLPFLVYFLLVLHMSTILQNGPSRVSALFELDESDESYASKFEDMSSVQQTPPQEMYAKLSKYIRNSMNNASQKLRTSDLPDYDEGVVMKSTTSLPTEPTVDEYRQKATEKLNSYRELHKSPPLTMNAWLNDQAEEYANQAVQNQEKEFVPQVAGERLGKNLFVRKHASGQGVSPSNMENMVLDAVESWYREIYEYNFEDPMSDHLKTQNFTNLIWKSSKNVGIGVANTDAFSLIVALFHPPLKNNADEFHKNIFPKEKTEKKESKFIKMMSASSSYF